MRPPEGEQSVQTRTAQKPATFARLEGVLASDATFSGDAASALPELSEAVQQATAARRVSIWQLSVDGIRLECIERFDAHENQHGRGGVLHQGPHPAYFQALTERRVLALAGPAEEAARQGVPMEAPIQACLDVPVRVRGRLVALLRCEDDQPRAWTDLQRWMVTSAADFLAQVLQTRELLRLEAEVRKHRQHLDDLVDRRTSQVIRSNADLQRTVDDLQLQAAQIRKSEDTLRRLFAAAPVPMLLIRRRDGRVVFANEKTSDTLRCGVDDLLESESDGLFAHPSDLADLMTTLDREGFVESLEVQLTSDGRGPFWALLAARPVMYEGDAAAMIGFSDLTAQKAVEHQLRFLATRDPLTQAYNRHHFWQLAQTEMARVRRYNRPLSIAMLDADHFKQLNDTYGHDVGDRALCQIVEACQGALRKNDVLARYGGEEFIVLFPETPGEGARLVMERLRQNIEAQRLELDDGQVVQFTVSVGVAGHLDEPDFDALLKRADEALYQAKRAGRNCVVAG